MADLKKRPKRVTEAMTKPIYYTPVETTSTWHPFSPFVFVKDLAAVSYHKKTAATLPILSNPRSVYFSTQPHVYFFFPYKTFALTCSLRFNSPAIAAKQSLSYQRNRVKKSSVFEVKLHTYKKKKSDFFFLNRE